MFRLETALLLTLVAALTAACADNTKRMTTLPSHQARGSGNAPQAVVLFRVVAESSAGSMHATVSDVPRWKWHFLINVGALQKPLDSGRASHAGQLEAPARDSGWGFVTLPAGNYQLAFASHRTRFHVPGAQRGALGFGQSGGARFEVDTDTALIYVGTFAFSCEPAHRWWGYVERECTQVEILDESEAAREVASSLGRFGLVHTALASLTK